jgi:hypothetical protein
MLFGDVELLFKPKLLRLKVVTGGGILVENPGRERQDRD